MRLRWRHTLGVLTAAALTAASVSACGGDGQARSIGYAFDGLLTTYNGNTAAGAASAAQVAFARVLPGFFYTGPGGQQIADTDVGTAKQVPGETLTIQYRLNAEGVYSNGLPTVCDDLVLTWAARSGRFTRPDDKGQPAQLFDAASTAGYADIDRVECLHDSKDATVVFRPGRGFTQWRTLFSAGALLPAHVAAKAAGVPDVVSVIRGGDRAALSRIADFWNTGWNIAPDKLDLSLLPAAGPYRIDSYSARDGLVLVANDRWWGQSPATPRIVLLPGNIDVKPKISQQAVAVADIGAGAVAGLDLSTFDAHNEPGLGTEQLTLATSGVFGSEQARRAFALCVPRQRLYDQFGHPDYNPKSGYGAGVVNSRFTPPPAALYPPAAAEGGRFPGGDAPAAQAALASGRLGAMQVRIGYLGPDERRASMVRLIAEVCKPAGITVTDAASADFSPVLLRDGKVDAVLGGPGAVAGASGSDTGLAARYAFRGGSGSNFGRYANPRFDGALDQLAVTSDPGAILGLTADAERVLWNDMPSVPLFSQPRTIAFAKRLRNGIANPSSAASGWNMDRWVLNR